MNNELKPCPFCGSEAELMIAPDNGFVIACQGVCEAQTCSWVNAKKARQQWNTRPDNWISVEDRLPEKSGEYIVCHCKNVEVADFLTDGKWCIADCYINVTHWMPLPDAPEGDS